MYVLSLKALQLIAMSRSSSSSSVSSSPSKYEFSDDTDSDRKRLRGTSTRPRRLPTSNSKNAVAARMNRMKQKQYVKDLEQKMIRLKREIKDVKRELREREKKWASSRRQVSYLRGMIANSHEIGHLLRNIRWRNIVPPPQGSSVDKTLNELNSETSVDRFPIGTSPSLFDGCFDLLEDRDYDRTTEQPPLVVPPLDVGESWKMFDSIDDPPTTEVGVCLHVSNRRLSIEFCDECSARFYDDPYATRV